jgi:hypothetical protein
MDTSKSRKVKLRRIGSRIEVCGVYSPDGTVFNPAMIFSYKDVQAYREINRLTFEQLAQRTRTPVSDILAFEMGVEFTNEYRERFSTAIYMYEHHRMLDDALVESQREWRIVWTTALTMVAIAGLIMLIF